MGVDVVNVDVVNVLDKNDENSTSYVKDPQNTFAPISIENPVVTILPST